MDESWNFNQLERTSGEPIGRAVKFPDNLAPSAVSNIPADPGSVVRDTGKPRVAARIRQAARGAFRYCACHAGLKAELFAKVPRRMMRRRFSASLPPPAPPPP